MEPERDSVDAAIVRLDDFVERAVFPLLDREGFPHEPPSEGLVEVVQKPRRVCYRLTESPDGS